MEILVINPGSISTSIAVYQNSMNVFQKDVLHKAEELAKFEKIIDQHALRMQQILEELAAAGFSLDKINLVISRGGLLKPLESGVYRVNDAMIRDTEAPMAEHIVNLGGYIARDIADLIGNNVEAYVADPSCVDEFDDLARLSGLPQLPRRSFLHTMNQKAVARRFAVEFNKKYEDINLIVAHLGHGITVGAHRKGKIVESNNGLDGDGPFSPERAGTIPAGQLVDLCFSGKYTQLEIKKMLCGNGGMFAYLGTNNAMEIEKRIQNGDEKAKLVFSAMAYQVAQQIGAMATVLKGEVDAILLTGGLTFSKLFTNMISERVGFIGKVYLYPGEDEMHALAMNGLMILKGELKVKEYF
ncbi:MAG: butyrate kinase [Bacteroidetes bacterium]|nr:butyrate kinase [Bacteroidota bacterium]